jgi:hypothetical protein
MFIEYYSQIVFHDFLCICVLHSFFCWVALKRAVGGKCQQVNSTVYFFFGVFLGLTALVFFGDLVAFFAGLTASFFAAAGFLAFGFAAFFSAESKLLFHNLQI